MSIFYNVATIDISSGLTDHEISSGQDYFILLDAPTNANVTVKLNENTAPAIPIKEYWQFKSKDVQKIYLSCDAVSGESIKYGQADGNLEITTNPVINSIDSITTLDGISTALNTALDKIINPYNLENSIFINGNSNSTSLITLLDITCDFDMANIFLDGGISNISTTQNSKYGRIVLFLDGAYIAGDGGFNSANDLKTTQLTLKNLRGKNLKINCINYSTNYTSYFQLEKINLKA